MEVKIGIQRTACDAEVGHVLQSRHGTAHTAYNNLVRVSNIPFMDVLICRFATTSAQCYALSGVTDFGASGPENAAALPPAPAKWHLPWSPGGARWSFLLPRSLHFNPPLGWSFRSLRPHQRLRCSRLRRGTRE